MDALLWQEKSLSLLDQGKYPHEEIWYDCNTLDAVLNALKIPKAVCGDALTGVAAAYAYCLAALAHEGSAEFFKQMSSAKKAILAARPDCKAIKDAFVLLDKAYEEYKLSDQLITALLATAVTIHRHDVIAARTQSHEGREILPDEANVVLLCQGSVFHTGAQSGPIGVLRAGLTKKKQLNVFLCEGRPTLDSHLVAHDLSTANIPVTLMPDHAAAALMPRRSCDLVLIEGLRAAKNGDLLAPAGAYALANAAFFHSIPIYATLPLSAIDATAETGEALASADYTQDELAQLMPSTLPSEPARFSPKNDVVLHQLLTGLITDKGIIFPPFAETIPETLKKTTSKPVLFL